MVQSRQIAATGPMEHDQIAQDNEARKPFTVSLAKNRLRVVAQSSGMSHYPFEWLKQKEVRGRALSCGAVNHGVRLVCRVKIAAATTHPRRQHW